MYGSGLDLATSKVACNLEAAGRWLAWLLGPVPLCTLSPAYCFLCWLWAAAGLWFCQLQPVVYADRYLLFLEAISLMEAGRGRGSHGNPLVSWVLLHPYGFWFFCPLCHMQSFSLTFVFLSYSNFRLLADARAMSFVPDSIMKSTVISIVQGHSEWLCPAGVYKSWLRHFKKKWICWNIL